MNAVSIQKVPDAFRDEGVPAPDRAGQLACDATFNRYASHWLLGESSLDSAYAAIEGISQLPGSRGHEFLKRHRPEIHRLLGRHFEDGVFRADGTKRTRGIFASHAAIGVMKSLDDVPCDPFARVGRRGAPALTHSRYDAIVKGLPGVGRLARAPHEYLLRLIKASASASPIRGAVLDHPESPLPPTLTVLYTASHVVWNLFPREAVERFFALIDEQGARRFLERCLRETAYDSIEVAGFTVHPASPEICANTTFFGLKLVERLGLWDLVLDSHLHHGMTDYYLRFAYKDGGFASTLQEGPSLNATFLSLRALKMLLTDGEFTSFVQANALRIHAFVERCSNQRNGGARFAPDSTLFVENCLATRYRLQIIDLLTTTCKAETPGDLLDDTYRFLTSCYRETDGFRAYAPGRLKVDVQDPHRWLETYLEERDERLRAALNQPDLERDLEIDRAYAELEELYAHREEEVEGGARLDERIADVQEGLRALQVEEARAYRGRVLQALADAGIDLDASERRLAEMRAWRAQHGDPATQNQAP